MYVCMYMCVCELGSAWLLATSNITSIMSACGIAKALAI